MKSSWNLETVKSDCQKRCDPPKNCKCEPAYAYRLVNAKQNYGESTGSGWLESASRKADYVGNYSPVAADETDTEPQDAEGGFDGNV